MQPELLCQLKNPLIDPSFMYPMALNFPLNASRSYEMLQVLGWKITKNDHAKFQVNCGTGNIRQVAVHGRPVGAMAGAVPDTQSCWSVASVARVLERTLLVVLSPMVGSVGHWRRIDSKAGASSSNGRSADQHRSEDNSGNWNWPLISTDHSHPLTSCTKSSLIGSLDHMIRSNTNRSKDPC